MTSHSTYINSYYILVPIIWRIDLQVVSTLWLLCAALVIMTTHSHLLVRVIVSNYFASILRKGIYRSFGNFMLNFFEIILFFP